MDQIFGIFRNNFINWVVLIGALVYFWNKYTPAMFAARKERIDSALRDAAAARETGEHFLNEQRAKVANAEQETQRIIEEARSLAAQLKVQMEEQTVKDLADVKRKIEQQIANERQLAITELRAAAARASIKLTESALPNLMTTDVKSRLLSQFMEQLDSLEQGPKLSAGQFESIH